MGDAGAVRRARDDRQGRRPLPGNRAGAPRGRAGVRIRLAAAALLAAGQAGPARPVGGEAATPAAPPAPALRSAYFGLDDALPFGANALCRGAAGLDGMPVVFATEIDDATLQPDDFAVTTASGAVRTPLCATLRPAIDPGERRTVLLIGHLGDASTDPPVRMEVVGDIAAADGSGMNFLGASAPVTPLAAGPTLVGAETVPPTQWRLDQSAGPQRGNGCPAAGTVQVVRTAWAGGVTNLDGDDPDAAEQALYKVTVQGSDGRERVVAPIAVADLGDGDNNHLLCLDATGTPVSVFYPAGHLYDPNRDAPNPDTRVSVTDALAARR